MLYAGLARQGTDHPAGRTRAATLRSPRPPRRLLDPVAAWYVGNVLLGTPPPENAARNRIAFKTGTSYGYRDAWAVGFDGRRTIGVWVGRPDGAPVPGLIGRTAAAPILFDAFARTGELPAPLPPAPKGAILAANGKLPLPLQRFNPDGDLGRNVERVRIMFPPNGARLELAAVDGTAGAGRAQDRRRRRAADRSGQRRAAGPRVGTHHLLRSATGPGFVRLTVVDGKGTADSVMVRMQ